MVSAANKLANVLLRKEQAKSKKAATKRTYRKAFRTGMRKGFMYDGYSPEEIKETFGATRSSANEYQLTNRDEAGYIGRGRYLGGVKKFLTGAWKASYPIRRVLGGAARAGAFGPYGRMAGQISQALGTGAYTTNDLVNEGLGASESVPRFGATSDQAVIISHSEYVRDIVAPDTAGLFQNQTIEINPGLFSTFPWLSQVAANYDEYELKQLIFTYKPTITDFVSTNGQVGTIILATQYNVQDEPFSNKNDMMHYAGAMSTKVSQGMLHGVECNPNKNSGSAGKYVRGGPVLPMQEAQNYDLGNLNIATHSTPTEFNSKTLGELWVSYTIELRKPKFYAAEGSAIVQDTFIAVPTGPSGSVEDLKIYPAQQNRINGYITLLPGGIIRYVFPETAAGTYKVRIKCVGFNTNPGKYWDPALSNNTHMFAVKDLITQDMASPVPAAVGWTWSTHSFQMIGPGPQGSGQQYHGEADIRVENPGGTGAINFIEFTEQAAANFVFQCLQVEVVSYNNSFNYNGSGQIMLIDNATDQLANPITTIFP